MTEFEPWQRDVIPASTRSEAGFPGSNVRIVSPDTRKSKRASRVNKKLKKGGVLKDGDFIIGGILGVQQIGVERVEETPPVVQERGISRIRRRVVAFANRTGAAIGRHEDVWRATTYGAANADILKAVGNTQAGSITGGALTAAFIYGIFKGIDAASGRNGNLAIAAKKRYFDIIPICHMNL